MKKSNKGMRKVSNPEIPIGALYAIGGITVFGIGFFIWRATRNIKNPIQAAIEAGGDCADRANSLVQGGLQGAISQSVGQNSTPFVNDFRMGSVPESNPSLTETSNSTPQTTTPIAETTNTTGTTQTNQTTSTTPVNTEIQNPPVRIEESLRDHLLRMVPSSANLTASRNAYESGLSRDQVVRIQNLLKDWHNRNIDFGPRVDSSFADGSIGRLTRALIYRVRTDTNFARGTNQLINRDNPNESIYLYPEFERQLRANLGLSPAGASSVDRGAQSLNESREWRGSSGDNEDFRQRYSSTSQERTDSVYTPVTGSGVRLPGQSYQESFYDGPSQPHTSSDPSSTRFYTSSGIKVKTKKRKL